jgi:hypothetical protein
VTPSPTRRQGSLPRPRQRDPQAIEEAVKRGVRGAIAAQWDKTPVCLVQVITVWVCGFADWMAGSESESRRRLMFASFSK